MCWYTLILIPWFDRERTPNFLWIFDFHQADRSSRIIFPFSNGISPPFFRWLFPSMDSLWRWWISRITCALTHKSKTKITLLFAAASERNKELLSLLLLLASLSLYSGCIRKSDVNNLVRMMVAHSIHIAWYNIPCPDKWIFCSKRNFWYFSVFLSVVCVFHWLARHFFQYVNKSR